jgi:hypothetical protein
MHTNHQTDSLSDWELSQLRDDEEEENEEPEQEYSGDLVW